MSERRTIAIVVAIGVALTLAAAAFLGAPMGDALQLVLLAVGGAALVAIAGWLVGQRLRDSSLVVQVTLITITAMAATLVGAALAAKAMFVSTHDLRALLVVLAAAGTAAIVGAVALAGRLTRAIELRDRERAMEESRRELVAWVSHDLRTPLSGIRAMVEALEDGIVDDPATVARYLTTIRQEADRLAGLVDDLFELSRIQAGALDLDLERVGLADLISDAIAASGVVAESRGVVLDGVLGDPAPEVAASVPDLARVIRNLLDNAIRHTPRGGAVRVEATSVGDHAVLSVHDGCGGIPEDELDRVFDLAFRGDAARTPGGGGGGFGLAIARGLVEAHQGQIAVCNEDGGCRFTVMLPLEE